MNEERLRILIQYLNTLSRLDGNYHNEIKVAIATIESELGITKGIKATINTNESVLPKSNFTK